MNSTSSTRSSDSSRSAHTATSVAAPSGFGLLVTAGLLWGTGGVTGSALADATGLGGPAVAAYRIGLGGLLLVLLLLVQRRAVPRGRPAVTRILLTGLLAALFQACYFAGVQLASVSIATLVSIGSAPMFVILTQSVRHHRLPSARQLRPVVLGIAGLAILVIGPGGEDRGPDLLAGTALALAAGAAFAVFTMLGTRPHVGTDAPMVTGYGFLAGGLVLAVGTAPFTTMTFSPTTESLGLLALFALLPTALAYTLYFRGLPHAGAATATVVALLEPLTATMLAVLLLGEQVSLPLVFGGALLLTSVIDAKPRAPGL